MVRNRRNDELQISSYERLQFRNLSKPAVHVCEFPSRQEFIHEETRVSFSESKFQGSREPKDSQYAQNGISPSTGNGQVIDKMAGARAAHSFHNDLTILSPSVGSNYSNPMTVGYRLNPNARSRTPAWLQHASDVWIMSCFKRDNNCGSTQKSGGLVIGKQDGMRCATDPVQTRSAIQESTTSFEAAKAADLQLDDEAIGVATKAAVSRSCWREKHQWKARLSRMMWSAILCIMSSLMINHHHDVLATEEICAGSIMPFRAPAHDIVSELGFGASPNLVLFGSLCTFATSLAVLAWTASLGTNELNTSLVGSISVALGVGLFWSDSIHVAVLDIMPWSMLLSTMLCTVRRLVGRTECTSI